MSDIGPGIAAENLQTIFERFKQVGGGVRASAKGFGLGLNIAKELVHLNFGDISVESELGKGSTFSFTIPHSDRETLLRRYLDRVAAFRDGSSYVSLIAAVADQATGAAPAEELEQLDQRK